MRRRKQSGGLYRLIYDEGTHPASSNDTDGAIRGNLLDDKTNKPVANAEWVEVDESEYESDNSYDLQENQQKVELSPEEQKRAQEEGEALAALIISLIEYAAPHVKRWWQNDAVPTMKDKWKTFTDKIKDKQSTKGKKNSKLTTNEIITENQVVREVISHGLEEAYEKYMNDMTSEEAQRELLDIFILSALLMTKLRRLSNAHIINNGGAPGEYLEGQKIIERLSTPEYIGSINRILENNPQLMEEKTSELSMLLGRNLVLNGHYVPIEIGKFKEAITLKVDGCDDA